MGDHKGGAGRRGRGTFVGEDRYAGAPNVPSIRQLETDPRAMRGVARTISADEQLRTRHADMLDAGGLGRAYVAEYRATYNRPSRKPKTKPITGAITQFTSWTEAQQVNYFKSTAHRDALRDLHDMLLDNAGFPF